MRKNENQLTPVGICELPSTRKGAWIYTTGEAASKLLARILGILQIHRRVKAYSSPRCLDMHKRHVATKINIIFDYCCKMGKLFIIFRCAQQQDSDNYLKPQMTQMDADGAHRVHRFSQIIFVYFVVFVPNETADDADLR